MIPVRNRARAQARPRGASGRAITNGMITVEASRAKFSPTVRRLRGMFAEVLPRLAKRSVQLGVFLISDAEMKHINRRTRGKDKATNVLSFEEADKIPHPEFPKGVKVLGEIFLAPDYIARKGEDVGALAVHGLLHLFGYTHAGARDRMRMERKEKTLLKLVIGKR